MKAPLEEQKVKAKAEELSREIPIDVGDIEWSIRGVSWVVWETMKMGERYFDWLIENLLIKDVELITKSKLTPTDTGFKLELEVEIPDKTFIFFAYNLGKLAKLIRHKKASVIVAEILRRKKRRVLKKRRNSNAK